MLKKQRKFGLGFTGGGFWETIGMPLVIVAILAAVAVPAYLDYMKRSRVGEALALAAPARAAVEKAFAAKGPEDMSQRAKTGWTAPAPTQHLQSVAIAKNGAITLRFTESVAPQGESEIHIVPVSGGKALDLSSAASAGKKFEWQCGGAAGKTTLPEKYRPNDCR